MKKEIEKLKEKAKPIIYFLKQRKVQIIIIGILILAIIIWSSWIRLQNLPLLKDSTTDKYMPLALDPFYFLRLAQTTIEQGSLPEIDMMRAPAAQIGFTKGLTTSAVVLIYRLGNLFSDISIEFADVIYPVIFFALGLIVFFFWIKSMINSKTIALISSGFLAIIPSYIYRTLAGFSDHEAIGMFAFFSTMLIFTIGLKFLNKKDEEKDKNYLIKLILLGILLGFLSSITLASWGGISKFVFLIIPLSFGFFWIFEFKDTNQKDKKMFCFVLFYFIWILGTIFTGTFFGYNLIGMIKRIIFTGTSIFNGLLCIFLLTEFSILKLKNKFKFLEKRYIKKYRILVSIIISIVLGLLLFFIIEKNSLELLTNLFNKFLHPFGDTRTGLTVSENQQPYLKTWISQTGPIFFWLFFGGLCVLGIKISEYIKKKKDKVLFIFSWVLLISGILFSRINAQHIFNGINLISKVFYFGSILFFILYFFRLYFKDKKFKIKPELILIFSWMIFMLIAARGAIRFFFFITPFICFSTGFLIITLGKFFLKSKGELLKPFLGVILIIVIICSIISFNNFVQSSTLSAKYASPSANLQWQNAMKWVRENTKENSIFAHWWDYGYWIQTLGNRPTVTDGGHAIGYWDHLIGRYLLTTPYPKTALSFMKSHNVSYLLIDPTDIEKYGAYSKIGSDEKGNDRYSSININFCDQTQTQENSESITKVYPAGYRIDEDIIYKNKDEEIFLPSEKAIFIGTILKYNEELEQPHAVYLYNNKQYYIPLKYVYFNGELINFGGGLEATIRIISTIKDSSNLEIDNLGGIIYLSPKVSKSLVAQLYLLNDPFNNYNALKISHSESIALYNIIKSENPNFDEIFYCPPGISYGGYVCRGFEGPIKIWKFDKEKAKNIIAREEFLRTSGEYAEFDDLEFTK